MTIPIRILSPDDLRAARGIKYSRAQLYRLIKARKFPQPVRLGDNRIGFVESEIDAWLESKMAARDAVQGVA